MTSHHDVVVVTGTGGMGAAVARRLGPGRRLVIGDVNETAMDSLVVALQGEGHDVTGIHTDVSDIESVHNLATVAAGRGRLVAVVHTAGVSPVQAPPEKITAVDVIGTANVLDAFLEHAVPGMVVVCIASMAGTMVDLDPETERALATTPTHKLAALPALATDGVDGGSAYATAKRANQLRVQAMAAQYGAKGARTASISPGVISTPMGQAELASEVGEIMRAMVEASATGRLGTPEDIAGAVEFLVSPAASFFTGSDLLLDGGVIAASSYPRPE